MKVPASIRNVFEDQKTKNDQLKILVDKRILSFKQPRWHYESRVKELVSFALKLESGRFQQPHALEDFFACTLVVANRTEVGVAEKLIAEHFNVKKRRPANPEVTHKAPCEFPFDDLRIYVTLQENPTLPPNSLTGTIFEVQIKTFLQHAWSIATHDLVYKTDDANWSKERIAYQTKAMLEHAEVSIQAAESLASSDVLLKEDETTREIKETIALLKKQWPDDELPSDVRRLAQNVIQLLRGMKLDIARLEEILEAGKVGRGGVHPVNLSPYTATIQYFFASEPIKLIKLLKNSTKSGRVLLPAEIDVPPEINRAELINAIFV